MQFDILLHTIKETHSAFQQQAVKAVNINLTFRNWLIGFYIVEFEQNGIDRAKYGEKLISTIASNITIKGLSETNLKSCRLFYTTYPQILGSVTPEFKTYLAQKIFGTLSQINREQLPASIRQSLSDQLQIADNKVTIISQTVSDEFKTEDNAYLFSLLQSASFSHFSELLQITDATKRRFYELLILKTTPSVRQLQRHIATLTFERVGLSQNTELAFAELKQKITPEQSSDIVKSHYFFDFLNLKYPQLVEETELEQALINHLQEFIIELGNGFCFEARQKRVLIGNEYYFIDLVFYHRILKCHVLIELKTEKAKHEHIGQLKAYIQHYKKMVMTTDDNPPVGILLVTDKNETLVEYAIAESDKELFVSKYQLQLPAKKDLEQFLRDELAKL